MALSSEFVSKIELICLVPFNASLLRLLRIILFYMRFSFCSLGDIQVKFSSSNLMALGFTSIV